VCQFGGTYPYCWDEPNPRPPEPEPCYTWYGCSDGGDGGDGGGGGSGDGPITPGEDDHVYDAGAPCVDLGCILKDPTPDEKAAVLAAISRIRTDIPICARIAANAHVMIGRELKIWHNEVLFRDENRVPRRLLGEAPFRYDFDPPGAVLHLYSRSIHPWTVAHEALHGLPDPNSGSGYHHHGSVTELGMTMDQTAKFCSGS
jgi:hypothetical protein